MKKKSRKGNPATVPTAMASVAPMSDSDLTFGDSDDGRVLINRVLTACTSRGSLSSSQSTPANAKQACSCTRLTSGSYS